MGFQLVSLPEADSWILPGADALFDIVQKHIEEKRRRIQTATKTALRKTKLARFFAQQVSFSTPATSLYERHLQVFWDWQFYWWSRYCPDPAKPCPKQTMKFVPWITQPRSPPKNI